jgi:hypothetical protein
MLPYLGMAYLKIRLLRLSIGLSASVKLIYEESYIFYLALENTY